MGGPQIPNCPDGRCKIPTGTFEMGSATSDSESERPVRQVTVSGFYIGKTEVTIDEYQAYLEKTSDHQLSAVLSGCTLGNLEVQGMYGETVEQFAGRVVQVFSDRGCSSFLLRQELREKLPELEPNTNPGNHPVVGLSFTEARAYCQYLGADVVTAAQLERVAKGVSGQEVAGTAIDSAISFTNGAISTAPVCGEGDERANSWGVCDVGGNVWEMTLDRYDIYFYTRMDEQNPYNPLLEPYVLRIPPANPDRDDFDEQHVEIRGGSFRSTNNKVSSTYRSKINPEVRTHDDVGFRCAWGEGEKVK